MTYSEIVSEVSKETGLPRTFVNKVYRAYWKAIRGHIIALPLKEDLTDEEFGKLQPNVSVPYLGKLNVTLSRYRFEKNLYNEYLKRKSIIEDNNAAHQES